MPFLDFEPTNLFGVRITSDATAASAADFQDAAKTLQAALVADEELDTTMGLAIELPDARLSLDAIKVSPKTSSYMKKPVIQSLKSWK